MVVKIELDNASMIKLLDHCLQNKFPGSDQLVEQLGPEVAKFGNKDFATGADITTADPEKRMAEIRARKHAEG